MLIKNSFISIMVLIKLIKCLSLITVWNLEPCLIKLIASEKKVYSRIHIRIRHPIFAIRIVFVTWCIRSSPTVYSVTEWCHCLGKPIITYRGANTINYPLPVLVKNSQSDCLTSDSQLQQLFLLKGHKHCNWFFLRIPYQQFNNTCYVTRIVLCGK